ncbi:Piso0_001914 [Millerozyma farinosa CBS 7064]|uniref:Transcription elongation factor SPT5 n=1 Tax=Pichia sorbitophila (strain ATCC MYA-4447 / BCRC 22081 / CBS 7064 / NBRC 10061 / NRRL Y-12695) TaxID=559304 RepID=G8YB70_PICSO|nr:Piso0_001914 [Millerozyma farinosa CBS 7064]
MSEDDKSGVPFSEDALQHREDVQVPADASYDVEDRDVDEIEEEKEEAESYEKEKLKEYEEEEGSQKEPEEGSEINSGTKRSFDDVEKGDDKSSSTKIRHTDEPAPNKENEQGPVAQEENGDAQDGSSSGDAGVSAVKNDEDGVGDAGDEQGGDEGEEGDEGDEGEEGEEGDEGEEGEEGDEDDDEDEDEDEDGEGVSSKKRKKRRANRFIDIEAEVDDEEEEELDEDDEEAELLREHFIADDNRVDGREDFEENDDRLHRQFDRRRQEAEDQDAEELAETLKQRYRRTHTVYRGDTATSGTVSQKLLMPSINDPAIYAIRCSPGREKELVRKLYEKKKTLARSNRPLEILTVFQRDSFRGYIYIEAKKPEAIERALAGMVNVYAKQRLLVPVREYPDLLKQVKSSDVEIVPGIYVRITRGKYKNDLAIVDNLSENGLDVRCKLVPRLDYGKNDEFDKDGKRIKSKARPIPRLFNESEAKMHDPEHLQHGRGPRSFIYRGEEYIDGFLYKDFKLQFIQTKDVHPRLEELDRFQAGNTEDDGLDLTAIAASLKNKNLDSNSTSFQPGDKVEVRRGEQARTVGKVIGISLNEVTLNITDSGDSRLVNQHLTVPASDLRKVFAAGDHVRVTDGKHVDETGLVIKIENDSVVLLSDQTQQDIRVFANYLIKATDASSNANASGNKFDIKDLVKLNASTVGVIVEAEKDAFKLITSEGRTITVKPSGIASKLDLGRREQVATDKNGLPVKIGDTVKETLGDKKREGVIIHIYKTSLFIKSNDILENLGIFVTNCMNVSTITTKGSIVSKNLGPDLNRMNPNLKLPNPIATTGLKTKIGNRDRLLNHDVIVNSGNYKGLMGKVRDADDTFARIELHSKSKTIKVSKNSLNVLVRGESVPYLRFIGASGAAQGNANNWNSAGRTKFNAPAFSSGSASTWGKNGGMTPAAGNLSSWGGSKTPAYNARNTSEWGGNGGASSWGGNGGASAWGGGASTWGGGASTWGNGGASTWGSGGTSTWGSAKNTGSNSTWGGNSTWDNSKRGKNSTWGGSSAWGSK